LPATVGGDVDNHDGGEFAGPAGNTSHRRRHRGFEFDQACQVAIGGEMLCCYRLGRPLCLEGDQRAGGVPRHQAGRAMDGDGLDQPAHLGVEPRHYGVHIAKLAFEQPKICSEVFKIGRHGAYTPVRLGCRYCSGAYALLGV
jgi:hypothetical protein